MKRSVIFSLVFVLLMVPLASRADQSYLEVTAPGNRQLQLAVATPLPMGGAARSDLAKTVADLFRFDMTLAGPFSVMSNESAAGIGNYQASGFDYAPWKAAGAELLIRTGYLVSGSSVTLECRLYDLVRDREVTAKRYSGSLSDLRYIAHTFSDEVLAAMTGEHGPFTGKVAFVSTRTGNKEIYLMDYDGYNVQRITRNGSINLDPDFSPDGRALIYTSYKRGNPDLYRREIFSGVEARISARRGLNITGAFAPDGNRIALTLSKDGTSQIYLISKAGKLLARLTHSSAIDVSPAWSPDGSQIAFVSDRLGRPQVFVMNADGSNVRRLTTSGSYNVSPRWSPKGDRIVYCRQMGNGFQVFAINPDGSGDTQLTSEGSNEHPRWSPDGRFLVFSSTRDGASAIYVMRSDGSSQLRVSRDRGGDSHPVWSPRW